MIKVTVAHSLVGLVTFLGDLMLNMMAHNVFTHALLSNEEIELEAFSQTERDILSRISILNQNR